MPKKISWNKLLVSIIVCQLAGAIGSIFTFEAIPSWYAQINKASFNPPNWLFGPVWTILYLLMGISLYLVWQAAEKNKKANSAMLLFGIQLALNTLWSIIFFGLKAPWLAFAEIIVLWVAILATIIKFYQISKKAAWLLVPYLLWVSFASILNLFAALLN